MLRLASRLEQVTRKPRHLIAGVVTRVAESEVKFPTPDFFKCPTQQKGDEIWLLKSMESWCTASNRFQQKFQKKLYHFNRNSPIQECDVKNDPIGHPESDRQLLVWHHINDPNLRSSKPALLFLLMRRSCFVCLRCFRSVFRLKLALFFVQSARPAGHESICPVTCGRAKRPNSSWPDTSIYRRGPLFKTARIIMCATKGDTN